MTIDSPNADQAMNPGSESMAEQPNWWLDDGVPGIGDKPSWLGDKFKTAADLGKSYLELEKRVGTAPDDYDFNRSKTLDANYKPFQELIELAQKRRVPKEVMDKVIDSVDKYFDEFKTDPDEEFKKLGDKAEERIKLVDNWAKANLSKESYDALTNNVNNAESLMALEEIRSKMMSSSSNIPGNNDNTNAMPTMAELQSELNSNLDKYKNDAKYRADWTRRMEMATKANSAFVDKFS